MELGSRKKGNDIISKLPESLISSILSFLPTKDAVRTSVLSKRWIHCWGTIMKVVIDDREFYSPNNKRMEGDLKHYFIDFVYKVLLLVGDSSLESFTLLLTDSFWETFFLEGCMSRILLTDSFWETFFLEECMSRILTQRTKKLHVRTCYQGYINPPSHSLSNYVTLEELILDLCMCSMKVPAIYVCFEHLKVLKLTQIIFSNDFSSDDYITLNFPVLEEFETTGCKWLNVKGVNVIAPLLESVSLDEYDFISTCIPMSDTSDFSCAIKFSDCHMKEFTYHGYGVAKPFFLSNTSSAHNACVTMYVKKGEYRFEPEFNGFILLNQFSEVKSIRYYGTKVLTQLDAGILPVFEMLSYLELSFVTGEGLLDLLQKSPVLETLVFKGISEIDQGIPMNLAFVPDCMGSTLKIVKFQNIYGDEHDLCLANFFLEKGIVLERMSFSIDNRVKEVMEEFKEKILSFKKGSSFALVEFSCD